MRSSSRRWLSCVALGAMAFACRPVGPPSASPRDVVVGRLAEAPGARALAAEPAVSIETTKLGILTRHATEARREGFLVRIPDRARRLAWSTAWPVDPSGATRQLEIALRTGPEGPWTPVATRTVHAGRGWSDHEVALPAGSGRVLRFRDAGARSGPAETAPLFGSVLLLGPPEAGWRPPNVVLISLDTLGATPLGAFGGPAGVSPRIDALLAESASFRRAYAPYGNTLVSHASLFSALYPTRHGVYGGRIPGPLAVSLVPRLADAGYRTVAFTEGAFVSAAWGFAVGFDAYDDGSLGIRSQIRGGAARTFSRAADWIERHADDRHFVLVHTYEVHAPYTPRDAEARRFADRLTPGDPREVEGDRHNLLMLAHNRGDWKMGADVIARLEALYAAEIRTLDGIVGRFLDRLEAAGLADETLVVLTADHADQFGEADKMGHGDSLHNRVLHVPLAFRWPGVIEPRWIAPRVSLVDVLPTVLDLVGLPVPPSTDGRSLADAVRRGEPPAARPVFSEQRSSPGECHRLEREARCPLERVAVQRGRFKLVDSQLPAYARLYDLERDPKEVRDVSGEHPDVARELRSLAVAYRRSRIEHAEGGLDPSALDPDTRQRLRDLGYVE